MGNRDVGRVGRILASYENHRKEAAAFALASLFVVFGVTMALRSTGVAASHTETVLDCQATGLVAHSHDASCFDAAGNLVCPLPEVELHRHTDDCYVETHELVCGMGEHAHGPECYDSEGSLVCEVPEHVHTDGCYETERILVCGQDEVTEGHVHGDGCFRTIEVPDDPEPGDGMAYGSEAACEPAPAAEDAAADLAAAAEDPEAAEAMPAQRFTHSIRDAEGALVLRVDVDAPEGALPAGATMTARWVEAESLSAKQRAAVANAVASRAEGPICGQQAVDVRFHGPDGAEVAPARRVAVTLTGPALDTDDLPVVAAIANLTDDELVAQAEALRSGATPEEAEPMRRAEALDRLSAEALAGLGITLANNQVAVACDGPSTLVISLTAVARTLRAEGETVRVEVGAPAAAGLPAGCELRVAEVPQGTPEHASYEADALAAAGAEAAQLSRFFDIKVVRADGSEVEPQVPVRVRIKLADAPAGRPSSVVHFEDGAKAGEAPELVPSEVNNLTTKFEAEGFSVWGVVYTVDFRWGVGGEEYEFGIPGGGFASLTDLVGALGVADDPKAFVAGVEDVSFSAPELLSVSRAEEGTTVGAIKEDLGLECEPSAELTEEQVAEVDATAVAAGDWALISLQPFASEETLTVTMKTGEQFVIRVTDAQISTHVITADGEDYTITVTYGPEAEIPDGATLEAEEILKGTDQYTSMLEQSKSVLSTEDNDTPRILFARFFDVSILDADGNEIEPMSPVSVSVQYANSISIRDAKPSVVHFADEGIEIIEADTRLTGEGKKDAINVFEYEQGSFSGIGTIVETNTLEDGQYFLVTGENGNYYALKNDGTAVPVTYYHQTKQVEAMPGTNENDLLWNVRATGWGYYNISANNGNYLTVDGTVVSSNAENVLVRHNAWDEQSSTETGGYSIYHAPNYWDQNSWSHLSYSTTSHAFAIGGGDPVRMRFAKYAMSETTGEPPSTNTYTGIEVNPSELDEWLMSLFDDMPVGRDGYHKTAEVYDYENRTYQIDFTALSNAQGFASDIDIAFSVDMSNSMLFPSVLKEVGTIELRQDVLESTLDKNQVYFVVSDVRSTATVNALFYEPGRWEYIDGQWHNVPAGWRYEDASKYARGQRKAANQSDSAANMDKAVGNNEGFKIQGTDTGFYTLYTAEQGYLDYINGSGSVYENPYNRLADMKESLRLAFNFLDVMAEKYHARIRVGWNGFARDVRRNEGGEYYDYRCAANGHALQDLEYVDYRDIVAGITQAGNQTGGGTRPDKAFLDAANMGWGWNTEKYLILITDGAPQGGGAADAAEALRLGKSEGQNLTRNHGVDIISIGLSTEHVDGAQSLFEAISCTDPNPDSDQQMIYQAKDGDALKNSVVDALRVLVSKATTVGTIRDKIDPAFYPVSTDGTPLKAGDKIDLSGKLTTDTSKPYGLIGWDAANKCYTVEWANQDIVWPDEQHPHGWHGRVIVKAKEDFLGGNDISTDKGQATLDVLNAKVLVSKNPDGSLNYQTIPLTNLMNLTADQLATRYMDTPHVNIDELEMTKNDTEWTVYLNTEVNPGDQMKALFNEIKVLEVVTDGLQEMDVPAGSTARDTMVYDLVPTENGTYSYEEAASDTRDKRNVEQASFYLKDLFNMTDSLGNRYITDMTAEQAIAKLLAGEKVEVGYQGYGHSNVGKIILELKADPAAQVNNLNEHPASPVGNAIEKYILTAEYKPTESSLDSDDWHTGTFGTKDKGKDTEDKTKTNTHIINVIKRVLTIQKIDVDGNPITDSSASFEIYQKDASDNKVNISTATTSAGVYTWDYVVPDEDSKVPGDYWADTTTYYIKEVAAPNGYAEFEGEIEVRLTISDTVTALSGTAAAPYNWMQSATLGATGNVDYVSVTGDSDITIAVKNDKSVDVVIIKTDTDGEEISGAKFSLTKDSELLKDIRVIKKGGSWDNSADRIEVENGIFTIPEGGVTILGLGAGNYTITETEAPAGYIKTLQPITFTAGRDGTVTYTNASANPSPRVVAAADNKQYTVQNEPGAELPHSGGHGVADLYATGIAMVAGALAYLLIRLARERA